MKKITVFTIFCFSAAVWCADSIHRINATHKPTAVTVYRSGALLTRTADVSLKKGRNLIVFSNIPDNINTGTIRMADQAAALPSCTVRSISWERATNTLYRNEEIRKLNAEKELLQQKIRKQQDHVEVLTKTLALLEQYRTIHGEAVAEQAYTGGKDNNTLWQSSGNTLATRYRNTQTEKRNTEGEITGTTLTLDHSWLQLTKFADIPREQAAACFSTNPAKDLGLITRGEIRPGRRADITIFDKETNDVRMTVSRGQIVYDSKDNTPS